MSYSNSYEGIFRMDPAHLLGIKATSLTFSASGKRITILLHRKAAAMYM